MITDYFTYAIGNLLHRRLRSWLTVLGITIGVAAVVALVSLGQGLSTELNKQFEKMGGDKLMIQGRGFAAPGTSLPFNLSDSDVSFVRRINGISEAVGFRFNSVKIEKDDQFKYVFVLAMPTGQERFFVRESFQLEIIEGRELRQGDKMKVILGYNYGQPNKIFTRPVKVGDHVLINDNRADVVGIYKQIGNPNDDAQVYISEEGYEEIFGESKTYYMLYARVAPDQNPSEMADVVAEKLRRHRGEEKGKETFFVQTLEELIQQFTVVLLVMQGILFMIACISLIVGAIGILNTMYTAVLERTKEIGVMKAIGAKNGDIFGIFLIESGFLGLVGGILGVLLGYSISVGLSKGAAVAGYTIIVPHFPWWLVAGTLAFAFIMGAASGSWPAWQAAKLNPVDALRWE